MTSPFPEKSGRSRHGAGSGMHVPTEDPRDVYSRDKARHCGTNLPASRPHHATSIPHRQDGRTMDDEPAAPTFKALARKGPAHHPSRPPGSRGGCRQSPAQDPSPHPAQRSARFSVGEIRWKTLETTGRISQDFTETRPDFAGFSPDLASFRRASTRPPSCARTSARRPRPGLPRGPCRAPRRGRRS